MKQVFFILNIEYIGKAVGQDGTREVADRLGNGHSKEAMILNHLSFKRTNREAYAVLYKPGKLIDSSLSYSDVVSTLEKTLITHFQPKWNEKDKNFPTDSPDMLRKLIENKINKLLITIVSPFDYGLLHSNDRCPERTHPFEVKINRSC